MTRPRSLLLVAAVLAMLSLLSSSALAAGEGGGESETPPVEEPGGEAPPPEAPAEEEGEGGGTYEAGSCPGTQLNVPPSLAEPQQEIRRLRNDLRAACEVAQSEARSERAVGEGLESELHALDRDLGVEGSLASRLDELKEAVQAAACASPCRVELASGQLPLPVESAASGGGVGEITQLGEVEESGFLSIRFALWFIAAVVVAGLAAYALVRLVVFRDN